MTRINLFQTRLMLWMRWISCYCLGTTRIDQVWHLSDLLYLSCIYFYQLVFQLHDKYSVHEVFRRKWFSKLFTIFLFKNIFPLPPSFICVSSANWHPFQTWPTSRRLVLRCGRVCFNETMGDMKYRTRIYVYIFGKVGSDFWRFALWKATRIDVETGLSELIDWNSWNCWQRVFFLSTSSTFFIWICAIYDICLDNFEFMVW